MSRIEESGALRVSGPLSVTGQMTVGDDDALRKGGRRTTAGCATRAGYAHTVPHPGSFRVGLLRMQLWARRRYWDVEDEASLRIGRAGMALAEFGIRLMEFSVLNGRR